jgi:hypothetical protein
MRADDMIAVGLAFSALALTVSGAALLWGVGGGLLVAGVWCMAVWGLGG